MVVNEIVTDNSRRDADDRNRAADGVALLAMVLISCISHSRPPPNNKYKNNFAAAICVLASF